MLLTKYLEAGTLVFAAMANRSEKFSHVGCFTKKRGGKANNSSNGLKALKTMKIIGNDIKMQSGISITRNLI